jgi:hypothetical protein
MLAMAADCPVLPCTCGVSAMHLGSGGELQSVAVATLWRDQASAAAAATHSTRQQTVAAGPTHASHTIPAVLHHKCMANEDSQTPLPALQHNGSYQRLNSFKLQALVTRRKRIQRGGPMRIQDLAAGIHMHALDGYQTYLHLQQCRSSSEVLV